MKATAQAAARLARPYSPAFTHADKKRRTIVIPNLSRSFSVMSSAVFRSLGYRAVTLDLADHEAQRLGKRFVHNDACFPAQINVGECLRFLASGKTAPGEVALALAKNCEDCRAGQYLALARKALDDAGHSDVAILTTGADPRRIHPGFTAGIRFQVRMLWGIALTDALDTMVRATRPYELTRGATDLLYEEHLDKICAGLERSVRRACAAFSDAVSAFNDIDVDRSHRKPRLLVIGEILMNYHETANRNLERYLEKNGMEVLLPDIVSFFWRQVIVAKDMARRGLVNGRPSNSRAPSPSTPYTSIFLARWNPSSSVSGFTSPGPPLRSFPPAPRDLWIPQSLPARDGSFRPKFLITQKRALPRLSSYSRSDAFPTRSRDEASQNPSRSASLISTFSPSITTTTLAWRTSKTGCKCW